MALTKAELLNYKNHNPSKFAHKFGHLDLDQYEMDEVVDYTKATTKLDGSPAQPTVADVAMQQASNMNPALGAVVLETAVPVQAPIEAPVEAPAESETVEPSAPANSDTTTSETTVDGGDVNGGTTLETNETV